MSMTERVFHNAVGRIVLSWAMVLSIAPPPAAFAQQFGVVEDLYIGRHAVTPFGGIGRYQNLLVRSEEFGTTWADANATAVTVSGNLAAANPSPNGTTTADRLTQGASTVGAGLKQDVGLGPTALANRKFTFSVWLKAASAHTARLQMKTATNTQTAQNKSADTVWERFDTSYTVPAGDTNTTLTVIVYLDDGATYNSLDVWGAQLEEVTNESETDPGLYVKTGATAVTTIGRGIVSNIDLLVSGDQTLSGNQTVTGTLAVNSAAAAALDVAGGIQAGSGNVGIIDATGKIPAISSTYFASLDGSALTNVGGASFGNQNANVVFAGPASGAAAAPSFRTLVDDDVPNDLTLASTKAASVKPVTDTVVLTLKRGTDTTPAAKLLQITNAAENADLFAISAAGQVTAGDVPWARLTSVPTGLADGGDVDDTVSGTELDGVFSANGLLKRTGAATYTSITDGSANWDTAYTDRLKWDGGATGLVAATGRTSLGLGGLATVSAVGSAEITDGQVSTDDLALDTIAAVDIAAGAVGTSELAIGSVTKPKLSELLATAQAVADKTVAIAAGKAYVSGNTVVPFAATNANFAAAGNCVYTPVATAKFVKALIALKSDNTLGCTLGTEQATKTAAQDEALTYPTDRLPIAEVILKTTGTLAGDVAVLDASDAGNSYLYADVRPHLNVGMSYAAGNGLQLSGTTFSAKLYTNPGLLADSTGLSLIRTCADNQLLKYTAAGGWTCASDVGSSGTATFKTQVGDADVDTTTNTLDFLAADFDVTSSPAGEANISLDANVAHLDVAETIAGNWVNTANPWLDTEVNDDLTISSTKIGSFAGPAITAAGTDILLNLSQTLNDTVNDAGTQTYTGLKVNLTETDKTSWETVTLLDLQVGGTAKFTVNDAGAITSGTIPLAQVTSQGNLDTDSTNDVLTSGSYSDQAWLTALAGSKISGNISGNAANVTGTVADANVADVLTLTNIKQTSGTTSGHLVPAVADDTFTLNAAAQTLTNKTLTSPVIANLAPGADLTITQNAVAPFTSVNTGAVANPLYLKAGNVGIGTAGPGQKLHVAGNAYFGTGNDGTQRYVRIYGDSAANKIGR